VKILSYSVQIIVFILFFQHPLQGFIPHGWTGGEIGLHLFSLVSPTRKAAMTPQERDLILNVFDRLAKLAGGAKDSQAEALIAERMRGIPDSAYNLVEAVVVQELAIKERDTRIAEL
jgi:hypothetical protein